VIGHLSSFGAGLLFGIGLWISGMAIPKKVLDFLDVSGGWDPSLLVVMAGAVGVTLVAFRPTLMRPKPLFGERFIVPSRTDVDLPLVAGAALFGLGWGIAGYCPGPALTALSNLTVEIFAFVAAMVAGGWLHRVFERRGLPAAAEST
jgi:uncharacterized membrane protein YedE/YeeE